MFEHLATTELSEILKPTATQEMGFQSYEMLAGGATYRKGQEQAFLAGQIRNPVFDYPFIDEAVLHQGINRLSRVQDLSRGMSDKAAADAVYDSASYRMTEMYWLLRTKTMNDWARSDADSPSFVKAAIEYQQLNEELYAKPDPETVAKVYGEILAQAEAKKLHPAVQSLLSELIDGCQIEVGGDIVTIPGIAGKEHGRLPLDINYELASLKEVLLEDFADVIDLVDQYWDEVVVQRPTKEGKEPGFTTEDMKRLFEALHTSRDPDNISGISIVIHPGSTQLAWDTPTMTVRIGEKRAAITDKTDMVAKLIHEYGVGLRAVNGLQTDLPVLGTGLYTDASGQEKSDYLTFEEGFASLCEIAIDDSFEQWKPLHVSRYLATACAYEGMDFRQAFEVNWRARAVMVAKDGHALTDQTIDKEKKQAYLSVTRVFRGTPSGLVNRPVLSFNKDLGYLEGKLIGLDYLRSVGDDKVAIRRLFKGKFDPTNQRQFDLAKRYIDL